MSGIAGEDDRFERYLLGHSSEEERAEIERAVFEDDATLEELSVAADDVIEDYLRDRLTGTERAFFETRYLAVPSHRARVAFIRDLLAATGGDKRRWAWAGGALAAGIAAAAVGGLVLWSAGRQDRPTTFTVVSSPSPTSQPPTTRPSDPGPRATPAQRPPRPRLPGPGGPHSSGVRDVRLAEATGAEVAIPLPRTTAQLRIAIEVPPEPPSFDVALRAQDGTLVWRVEGVAPRAGEPLVVQLPAQDLLPQRYALLIDGEATRDGGKPVTLEYTLRIVREGDLTPPATPK